MTNLKQEAAELLKQLQTRGTTVDLESIEALLEQIAAAPDREPIARVKRWVNSSIIDSTGCRAAWQDLPDGTPLYTSPPVASAPNGWKLVKTPITEEMHAAAAKELIRASGIHGTPQCMLDAMLAAEPDAPAAWTVKVPTTEDEAAGMVLIGIKWLEENAPRRLTAPAALASVASVPDEWRATIDDAIEILRCDVDTADDYGKTDLAEVHNDMADRLQALIAAATEAPAVQAKPLAWIRLCSDGGYEGPIADCDSRMDSIRRDCGAWTPLYATQAPAEKGGS